jgi:hypothetical protein
MPTHCPQGALPSPLGRVLYIRLRPQIRHWEEPRVILFLPSITLSLSQL